MLPTARSNCSKGVKASIKLARLEPPLRRLFSTRPPNRVTRQVVAESAALRSSSTRNSKPSASALLRPVPGAFPVDDGDSSPEPGQPSHSPTIPGENGQKVLPSDVPVVTAGACGHILHPDFVEDPKKPAGERNKLTCPPCMLQRKIGHFRATEKRILKHGSSMAMKQDAESIFSDMTFRDYKQAVTGRDQGPGKWLERHAWRNRKVQLMRIVRRCKELKEIEKKWETDHPEVDLSEGAPWDAHTADMAVELWEQKSDENWNQVQEGAAQYMHKRAREDEEWLNVVWGDRPSEISAQVSQQAGDEVVAQEPPKRKRRCIQSVSFHDDVFVRTDSDVDVLRNSASFNVNPHKEKQPQHSILRTNTKNIPPKVKQPATQLPKLKLPHSMTALTSEPS